MAVTTHSTGPYTSSDKLEDQAASAALHVTRDSEPHQSSTSVLDEDGKLSSAGAATSLKYARAQDLPSFPSAGLKLSSAGAAASLADSNKKPFEHWKPGAIPTANRAANLAKDYEMDPLWKPEMSAAGSRAALLAHRDPTNIEVYRAPDTVEGHSAAGKAVKSKPVNAITERNPPADAQRKALLAATGAMSSGRQRADSAPIRPVPDNSWALKAANKSHVDRPVGGAFTSGDPGFEAARIQNLAKSNVNRQMYGSAPPVSIEVEERNRQDTLRASAVAMAQKMYAMQQKHIDEAAGGKKSDSHAAANSVRARALSSSSSGSGEVAPQRYENLEEAARKLAQERLAKLHDEHAEYRSYYGQSSPPKRGLSMKLRRRASSATRDDSDQEQSRRIRSQMSIFHSKLAEVDGKKKQADRDALLEAAHRNVEARMKKLDDKIFQDTGKASPAQLELWDKQARERAQRESDERMQHAGKIHIGGGRYLDQAEVDAIARARLQPTLDEISDKAEKQRARDAEIRLEQEKAKADAEKERTREAEVKAEVKAATERDKQEQRSRKYEEKRVQREQASAEKERRQTEAAAEKERKQAEQLAERERVRLEKEDKRKSKDPKSGRFSSMLGRSGTAATSETVGAPTAEATKSATDTDGVASDNTAAISPVVVGVETTGEIPVTSVSSTEPTREVSQTQPVSTTPAVGTGTVEAVPPTLEKDELVASPTRGDSKMRSWFKTRFRSGSKAQKDLDETPETPEPVGSRVATEPTTAEDTKPDSIRDVAMAGRGTGNETPDLYGDDEPVSPVRDGRLAAEPQHPSPVTASATSPVTTSKPERAASVSSVSSISPSEIVPRPEPVVDQGERKGLKARLLGGTHSSKGKGKAKEGEPGKSSDADANATDDDDEFEEARDTFTEEKLAPPHPLSSAADDTSKGQSVSPQASREGSRFTEEL